jgi:hypothetical protein
VGGGARFLLQAMMPQTAVMREMSSSTAHRLTISATNDTPPASWETKQNSGLDLYKFEVNRIYFVIMPRTGSPSETQQNKT